LKQNHVNHDKEDLVKWIFVELKKGLILNVFTKGFDKTRIKCEDYNYQLVEISTIIDGYFNLGNH
jgi:hypothetical protein